MHSFELGSVQSFLGKLGKRMYAYRQPIGKWTVVQADYRKPGDTRIQEGPARTISIGDTWSADTLCFESTVEIGSEFDGKNVYLEFCNDGEGLLFVNGSPISGLDENHRLVLIGKGRRQVLNLKVESTRRWQNTAHAIQIGADYTPQVFRKAELCTIDEDIEFIYYVLCCMLEAGNDFGLNCINKARIAMQPDLPYDAFMRQCSIFREELEELLRRDDRSNGVKIFATGHSHLDLGYLWPIKETVRKAGRTFASMLHLLDHYPEFHFSQSQAILYEWAKEYYPELYARIKEYVRQGRWEPVGGMYVESDGNLPSGESIIRQFLEGISFFDKEFGVRPEIGWLPDTFGLSGMLPQILYKCGIRYFYSAKLRSNNYYRFPYTLYEWEGIDGTRIKANLAPFDSYDGQMKLRQITDGVATYDQDSVYDGGQFYTVGHGDGGGGVTTEMMMRARIYNCLPGLPRIEWSGASKYFNDVEKRSGELPIWVGEQYYDVHQGTLTSQAALKRYNRMSEIALRNAEILDVMSRGGHSEAIKALWKDVLLYQFHDILPGSCQSCVAEEASEGYKRVLKRTEDIQNADLSGLAPVEEPGSVTVFNMLSFPRNGIIEIDGKAIGVEDVPPLGYKTVSIRSPSVLRHLARETNREIILENELLTVTICKSTGDLTSVHDKIEEREVLKGRGNYFILYQEMYEFYDAWNIHRETLRHPMEVPGPKSVKLVRDDGCVAAVDIERDLSENSSLRQHIRFRSGSRRIDFDTTVDWHETGKMLKVGFNAAVHSPQAYFDISYGNISRSTTSNMELEASQIEVCAHKWADLSDAHYGVALLNDCKYGHRIKGNELTLTLLKSSKYPDPNADMGIHRFVYCLYPHPGDFRTGLVDREAYDLNIPFITLRGKAAPNREYSLLFLNGKGVYSDAVKFAHDGSGDIIVRIFENHGGQTRAQLNVSELGTEVFECDMLESVNNKIDVFDGWVMLQFEPYEIKTIRIR